MNWFKKILFICSILLIVFGGGSRKVEADTVQPAMWFMDAVNFSQVPGGNESHAGTLNFDVLGYDGNNNIKAPFDCTIRAIFPR